MNDENAARQLSQNPGNDPQKDGERLAGQTPPKYTNPSNAAEKGIAMSKAILEQIKECNCIFDLAEDYDGACPCADFHLKDDEGEVYAHSQCWRVSDNDQDLYVWGDHPNIDTIAKVLKKSLDETEWYNPYTVIMEAFK